tara:strand:+ start:2346 stop:2789 length:444 start_codon:yes stop_codon:yes gene_type:complete
MSKFKGYKECQEKYMDETMKKFENKKLIISGKRYVKDRKQAVAIALDTAQRKCKYSSKDYSEMKEKVNMFLHNDDRKISETRIPLTNVIETKVLIKHYLSKKNRRKALILKDDLIKRIVESGKKGIKISKNIFEEISEIYQLLNKKK